MFSAKVMGVREAACDYHLLNIRHHCELPVAANRVNPSGIAMSHRFLQSWLIPEKANARDNELTSVHA
jgi:hypothetical protein